MSTDKQNEQSPDDQIAYCRRFAERQGWAVVESLVVAEAGISGASRHNRPGLLDLVERIAEWEVLLCWDSSRLARNQEDLGWLLNRLRSARRTGYAVSTGLELLNVGARVMGVFDEEYRHKLRADVQRGLLGRFDRQLATGGTPFGYRTVPIVVGHDAHGHPKTHGYRLEVAPELAPVVVRLFEGYARQGLGLRVLAHRMNAEGIAAPRARREKGRAASWAPTAIREMLRNPIYRGERIYNRSEWIKDHATGKRTRFERPESEWVRQHDEAWRIVSDELWRAAQEARGRRNERHVRDEVPAASRKVVA
jgi:DNA invertase Pin-like site-specific DNA recombinase